MYWLNIEKVNLNNKISLDEVKEFLRRFDLDLDKNVDYTLVIRENGIIKATASKSKSVLKCFAISKELQGEGISNKLITALNDKLFEEGIYHSFVFTKPNNIELFTNMGYKLVAEGMGVILLENGIYDINKYLKGIIKNHNIDINKKHSALVMNSNHLTEGHI